MNRSKTLFLLASCLSVGMAAFSQDKIPVKFGKVTLEDFSVKPGGPDSSASASMWSGWRWHSLRNFSHMPSHSIIIVSPRD